VKVDKKTEVDDAGYIGEIDDILGFHIRLAHGAVYRHFTQSFRKFLMRGKSHTDSRKQTLTLAPAGIRALLEAKRAIRAHEKWLKTRFSVKELKTLIALLRRKSGARGVRQGLADRVRCGGRTAASERYPPQMTIAKKPKSRHQIVSLGGLPDSLGYLIRRAQLAVFQAFIDDLKAVELTPGKYSVLLLIGENPGLPQSAICEALGILKGNFVGLLHEFERRGLAERRAGGADARTNALHLTRKGRNLLSRATALRRTHEARLEDSLGKDRCAQLKSLLLAVERTAGGRPIG
jgi:DNA-binding MarR family transcriptional regulator